MFWIRNKFQFSLSWSRVGYGTRTIPLYICSMSVLVSYWQSISFLLSLSGEGTNLPREMMEFMTGQGCFPPISDIWWETSSFFLPEQITSFWVPVLWIRIGFSADPDPALYFNADPDPGSQTNSDPDPGSQTNADPYGSKFLKDFWVKKVELLILK